MNNENLITLPRIMKMDEILAWIPISRRKLQSDMKSGLMPFIKMRGRILFRQDQVEAALEALTVRAKAADTIRKKTFNRSQAQASAKGVKL